MKIRTIATGMGLATIALALSGCYGHHNLKSKTYAHYGKTQKYHVNVTPVRYKTVTYKKVYKPHYIKKVYHH